MSNAMAVDFTPLTAHPIDPVGDFINAFDAGQALARRGPPAARGSNSAPTGPAPISPAPMKPDPVASLAAIAALDGAGREAARQKSEQLGAVLLALQGVPDGPARLAMARHAAPAFGLAPAEVSPADVSDTGLAAHRAQAVMLQHLLTPAPADPSPADPAPPDTEPAAATTA